MPHEHELNSLNMLQQKCKTLINQHPVWAFIAWDFLIAIPISYISQALLKTCIRGCGHFLSANHAVFLSRCSFVAVDIYLILTRAAALRVEAEKKRDRAFAAEIKEWDEHIETLEKLRDAIEQEKKIELQLKSLVVPNEEREIE